jgi:pimeloyl-ACP methyl ester carboxylesterase
MQQLQRAHASSCSTRAVSPDTGPEEPNVLKRWMTPLASYPTETHRFQSFDGVELAWTEMGQGRPAVLIHGYFSTAEVNWIRYGHAEKLAGRGFRVIMPDLRGHGLSAKPHDPAAYPPDVLMHDGMALVAHLGLVDYDLGGYSLGARTTVRMLAQGATPRRVALAGMGLQGLLRTEGRGDYFRRVLTHLGSFERGSSEWLTEAFLKTTKGDPEALLLILDTFVDTPRDRIAAIAEPTVVIAGAQDFDNGAAHEVADLLRDGRFVEIPGNHMSAVTRPELGQAIADFLAA